MLSRLGVIGDVHCESETLGRVLDALETMNVDAVLCVGDLVDGPGDADTTLDMLEARAVHCVAGNHERWFLASEQRSLETARPPISDTPGGFRCIRRNLLERIEFERIRSDGYAFQIEMNYRFLRHGARIKEIPFFFLDRERGVSKLSLRIAMEALWIVWWLRFANATGRL